MSPTQDLSFSLLDPRVKLTRLVDNTLENVQLVGEVRDRRITSHTLDSKCQSV